MRTHRHVSWLATSLVALLTTVGALSGCSGMSEGTSGGTSEGGAGGTAPEGASTAPLGGDVPFALVLPDDLAVSQDGAQVLADCWQGICRWDTADASLTQVLDGGHVALSPDWSLVATIGDGAEVVLSDTESGEVVRELAGHADLEVTDGSPVHDVAFSADGRLVAAAGLGGDVIVWSVADGAQVSTIAAGEDVFALAFSPDGSRLATAGGAPAQVFEVASGRLVTTLAGSSSDSAGLAWSPDGRWLAAPGPDAAPAVWDTDEFALAEQLTGRRMRQVAWSPDSTTLAVTDTEDDLVRLWRPRSRGAEPRELAGHTDGPGAVVFAPDGTQVYSVAGDDGVFGWDVAGGRRVTEFELPER